MLYLEPQLSPKEEILWFNQRPRAVWERPVGVRSGGTAGAGRAALSGGGGRRKTVRSR